MKEGPAGIEIVDRLAGVFRFDEQREKFISIPVIREKHTMKSGKYVSSILIYRAFPAKLFHTLGKSFPLFIRYLDPDQIFVTKVKKGVTNGGTECHGGF